jgi:hypothetical protein
VTVAVEVGGDDIRGVLSDVQRRGGESRVAVAEPEESLSAGGGEQTR